MIIKKKRNLIALGLTLALFFPGKTFAATRLKIQHNFEVTNKSSYSTYAKIESIYANKYIPLTETEGLSVNVISEENGHRKFRYTINDIKPNTKGIYSYFYVTDVEPVDFKLDPLKVDVNGSYPQDILSYLNPTYRVESSDIQIKNKANEILNSIPSINRNNPYYIVKGIYDYVQTNMNYTSGNNYSNRGALWALNTKVGSCEDYASLMTALLRASGVPARTVTGFKVKQDQIDIMKNGSTVNLMDPSRYTRHMWVEAYIKGYGWVPFDPTVSSSTSVSVGINYNGVVGTVTAKKGLSSPYYNFFGKLPYYYIKEFYDNQDYMDRLSSSTSYISYNHAIMASVYTGEIQAKIIGIETDKELQYSNSATQFNVYTIKDNGTKEVVDNSKVTWVSTNPSVMKVTNGLVEFTGLEGNATLKITYNNFTIEKSIVVKREFGFKNNLSFNLNGVQLYVNNTINGINQNEPIQWESTNPEVATVDNTGFVKFSGKNGTVKIRAKVLDKTIETNEVNVNSNLMILGQLNYSKDGVQLKGVLNINGTNYDLQNPIWESTNPEVATVDNTGFVKFSGKNGTVKIVLKDRNFESSISTEVNIPVENPVNNTTTSAPTKDTTKEVSYETKSETDFNLFFSKKIENNMFEQKVYVIKEENGQKTYLDNSLVKWYSTDEDVITVENGVIKLGYKNGTATVVAEYNGKEISQTVTVVGSYRLNTNLKFSLNGFKLIVYRNINRINQEIPMSKISWVSSNNSIATVSNGIVNFTGKNGTVSVTAEFFGQKLTTTTTVNSAIKPLIYINAVTTPTIKLPVGLFVDNGLVKNINPSEIKFTSSDESIVKVDKNGVMYFTGKYGRVYITIEWQGMKTYLNMNLTKYNMNIR